MTTLYYESFGLHDTVRVGMNHIPEWGSPAIKVAGVEHGIEVPHTAANLPCAMTLSDGRPCRKRAGHPTRKGSKAHVAVDSRLVASPRRVVHTERFKPNTMPRGIDMTITVPHNCENHWEEPGDDRLGAPLRGR